MCKDPVGVLDLLLGVLWKTCFLQFEDGFERHLAGEYNAYKLYKKNYGGLISRFKHLTPVVNDVSFSKCVIENQIQL